MVSQGGRVYRCPVRWEFAVAYTYNWFRKWCMGISNFDQRRCPRFRMLYLKSWLLSTNEIKPLKIWNMTLPSYVQFRSNFWQFWRNTLRWPPNRSARASKPDHQWLHSTGWMDEWRYWRGGEYYFWTGRLRRYKKSPSSRARSAGTLIFPETRAGAWSQLESELEFGAAWKSR